MAPREAAPDKEGPQHTQYECPVPASFPRSPQLLLFQRCPKEVKKPLTIRPNDHGSSAFRWKSVAQGPFPPRYPRRREYGRRAAPPRPVADRNCPRRRGGYGRRLRSSLAWRLLEKGNRAIVRLWVRNDPLSSRQSSAGRHPPCSNAEPAWIFSTFTTSSRKAALRRLPCLARRKVFLVVPSASTRITQAIHALWHPLCMLRIDFAACWAQQAELTRLAHMAIRCIS